MALDEPSRWAAWYRGRARSVTSTERAASWLRAYGPGRATQSGFGTIWNIRT